METLLSPMVDKVYKAILNEAHVIANFGDEFEQLKKGLETTNDLLANSMNLQSKYDMVKGALSQLREVVDEADDVLTDCLIREIYKENRSFIRCCFHDMGFSSRVGKQLADINSKMDKASTDLGKHLQMANSIAPDRTHGGESDADQSGSDREFMSSNYLPSKTYGLEKHIAVLKERMFGSTNGKLNSMAIVGMGGLGKTTIAKKFFTDTQVISHFNKMIWVTVSQNFSKQRIVKCMLEKANLRLPDVSNSDNLFTTLRQGLEGQAYLIVMDDVWSNPNLVEFWTALCDSLPTKGDKSSCIIITTRSIEVARAMVHQDSKIVEPPKLNLEDTWSLFSICAFPLTDGKCPNELFEEEGRAIVEKCGGLPLAIKTVGSCMAKEGDRLSEWTKTKEKFHSLITEGRTDAVMVCLQLSYDELPTDMKQCMLCLSVYPEDFEIQADQLIHWWFGEGLIRGKESDSKTELGYENLARLANRCLLEVVERRGYDGRILKFKIHDMVRELITRIAEKEKFCNFSPECMQIKIEDSRWLCLTEDMTAELKKPWKRNSKLRVLLFMSSPSLIDFSMKFVFLESLRVLDLSNSKLSVMNVEDSNTASSGTL